MAEKRFRPRRFGYGAVPSNWKGRLFVGAYVAAVLAVVTLIITANMPVWPGVLVTLVTAAAIIPFTKTKTDGNWRWR